MTKLRIGASMAGALFLSSCASVGPDFVDPTIAMPAAFVAAAPAAAPAVQPSTRWWTSFRDRTLDGLIEAALADNLDVLTAIERVIEVRASARVSEAGAFPSVTTDASYRRKSDYGADAVDDWSAEANASWEIDLFGRYRRQREADIASVKAAEEDANAARLSLIGTMAEAYANARGYQSRLAIARMTIEAWETTLTLIRAKAEAGATSRLEVAQAEAEVESTRASMPSIETALRESILDIGVLLGGQPAAVLPLFNRGGPIPYPQVPTGAGIPADLIRNRPDIRAAERELAAATAMIGVGVAQLFPNLSLSGVISTVAASAAKLGTAGTVSWSFGPTIDFAIFEGGKRRAQVAVYRSQASQEYLAWKSTVLTAVGEVEKALAAYANERKRKASLEAAVASYAEAAALANERYRTGAGDFLDVLEAQRSLHTARDSLAECETQVALYFIELNVALGGGWSAGSGAARD